MKKLKLIIILSFLVVNNLFAQTHALKIKNKVKNFLTQYLLPPDTRLEILEEKYLKDKKLYRFKLRISQKYIKDIYATEDGELIFLEGINTKEFIQQIKRMEAERRKKIESIPKKEKANIQIFVMSYCPFALQIEKAFLPVYRLLKEKINFKLRFVDYTMHGEKECEENLRQYCIQKEEKRKIIDYLDCFIHKKDYKECFKEVKINERKVGNCIERIKKKFEFKDNKFELDEELNKKYKIIGSPTFVINDVVINVERSPEAIKELICTTLKNKPSLCKKQLSKEIPSPGLEEKDYNYKSCEED
ncbi:MAG: hypothetical protein B6D55_07170 [Candidatus Omnitrophica bacterium 4484_70.2]|nr:MAG: hypothetical protein B6D55_07170 [Candidatus Omnitrophica bacterium 4484_70.2]